MVNADLMTSRCPKAMTPVTIYLDTSIISRIGDLRLKERTALALERIADDGRIQLVTSDKTLREILATSNPRQRSLLRFIVAAINKVPMRCLTHGIAIGTFTFGAGGFGIGLPDEVFAGLKEIFDADDAEHIAQAVHNRCDFFLTLDESTILSRVGANACALKTLLGKLEIVSPEQLATRLCAVT